MGSEAGEAGRRPSLTLGEGDTEGRLDGGIQTSFQFKDVPTGSRSHSTRQKNAVSARNRPKHCCGKQGSVKRSGWTSEQGTWCSLPRTHPGPGGLGGTVSQWPEGEQEQYSPQPLTCPHLNLTLNLQLPSAP